MENRKEQPKTHTFHRRPYSRIGMHCGSACSSSCVRWAANLRLDRQTSGLIGDLLHHRQLNGCCRFIQRLSYNLVAQSAAWRNSSRDSSYLGMRSEFLWRFATCLALRKGLGSISIRDVDVGQRPATTTFFYGSLFQIRDYDQPVFTSC